MSLSEQEIERYARHIVLAGVGGQGQNKIREARVLVIGAGGLGSPLLLYLAAAGVGTLAIADDDEVSLSNLQRQVLHGTPDIGRLKGDSARDALLRLNPHVRIEVQPRLTAENARDMVQDYDVVADGSDNFETRYAVSDACFYEGRTLVTAAVGPYDASLTTFKPHLAQDGVPNPTYRCLFPDAPPPGMVPACVEAGVLGALTGMVGSLMALEVIREIVGGFRPGDQGLVGKLLLIDVLSQRYETLVYSWDPANPLSGRGI